MSLISIKIQWYFAHFAEMPFGQLPIFEEDGKVLCNSAAISRYLARKFGMYAKYRKQHAQCDYDGVVVVEGGGVVVLTLCNVCRVCWEYRVGQGQGGHDGWLRGRLRHGFCENLLHEGWIWEGFYTEFCNNENWAMILIFLFISRFACGEFVCIKKHVICKDSPPSAIYQNIHWNLFEEFHTVPVKFQILKWRYLHFLVLLTNDPLKSRDFGNASGEFPFSGES